MKDSQRKAMYAKKVNNPKDLHDWRSWSHSLSDNERKRIEQSIAPYTRKTYEEKTWKYWFNNVKNKKNEN